MTIELESCGKTIILTDERSESSHGIPVLIFEGVAYGPEDSIPLLAGGPLDHLKEFERARTTVAVAARGSALTAEQQKFLHSFTRI